MFWIGAFPRRFGVNAFWSGAFPRRFGVFPRCFGVELSLGVLEFLRFGLELSLGVFAFSRGVFVWCLPFAVLGCVVFACRCPRVLCG